MEALQLAQMLADLNDLQAAQDQTASRALVTANKTLDRRTQSESILSTSKSAVDPPVAPANGGGKFGRHLFTPPLSRTNSATPSSIPGTPKSEGPETDITRASTLLSLYEIRAKLKEQDSSSLQKAREKVNALAAKHSQTTTEKGSTLHHSRKGSGRINYPK